MESIYNILSNIFKRAIEKALPAFTNAQVVVSLSGNNPKFGDYQCNSAMAIANIYKHYGTVYYHYSFSITNVIIGFLRRKKDS